jgi:hypothetical protein
VIVPGSPATTSTADTRSSSSRTSATASRSRRTTLTGRPRRCSAPALTAYRSLRLAGDAEALGLYGFGASAHIVCQVAVAQGRRVFAGTRAGDDETQAFARSLGAAWAGDAQRGPPEELDAVVVFAPVGALVPAALGHVRKGGTVVCAGIHMSDIPAFPYELLWGERVLRSVANLTREDGNEFLAIAATVPVRVEVETFALEDANEASPARRSAGSGVAPQRTARSRRALRSISNSRGAAPSSVAVSVPADDEDGADRAGTLRCCPM